MTNPPRKEATMGELLGENSELRARVALLETQIGWLRRQVFGPTSERVDPRQMGLAMQEAGPVAPVPAQEPSRERAKPAVRGEPAYARLPVSETVTVVPGQVRLEPERYEQIGEERTFEVDIDPPRFFKREIVRPKYRLIADKTLPPVVAPAPARLISGGHASAGLVAWVLNSKYLDHLPLYRMEQMFGRWGLPVSRRSMNDWVRLAAGALEPVCKLMPKGLLKEGYLQMDETPVKRHDPDLTDGRCRTGYLWVLDHPGGNVLFHWETTRSATVPAELLKEFEGILQTDGYNAHDSFTSQTPKIEHLGCWAHARRKFFEAQSGNSATAGEFLALIRKIYELERLWTEENTAQPQRLQLRRELLAPLFGQIHALASRVSDSVLPRSRLGVACDYLLSQWRKLSAHLAHGHTKPDNNSVENAIRPSAIGKKNWLFVGHPQAGQRTAIIYTLILSCRRHGKPPLHYLRDLLSRLPAMKNSDDLSVLLPQNWEPAQPSA